MVAATIQGGSNDQAGDDGDEEETETKRLKKQRDKNIKLLRKQVLALAQEELAIKGKTTEAMNNKLEL